MASYDAARHGSCYDVTRRVHTGPRDFHCGATGAE